MLKLIKNEYAKIFYKKTTYIILALCILLGIGMSTLIHFSNDYDYFYYNSFEDERNWYADSDSIWDKLNLASLDLYEDMGYKNYSEIPDWVSSAAYDYIYNHYAYVLASQSDATIYELFELGIQLSDTDIDYEKEICEKMYKAIKGLDYTSYYKLCIEYYEHQTARQLVCSIENYEFARCIMDYGINPETDDDMIYSLNRYVEAKIQYDSITDAGNSDMSISEEQLQKVSEEYFTYKYIIENRIENYMLVNENGAYSRNKFITALTEGTVMAVLAGIFIIIIAAGIFANEYSNGTIKFLLINPVKRAKIFWSKYFSCLTLFAGALVVFYIVYFLFSMILCGTNGIDGVLLSYADGVVKEQSVIIYSLKQYGFAAISLITLITLAFTISSFIRSTALAIAISVAIEFAGSGISLLLYELGYDWGRYLLFSNTDLASFSNGIGMFPGQTLTFALVAIAVYMVVFLLTAYDGFTRKDI